MFRLIAVYLVATAVEVSLGNEVEEINVELNETQVPEAGVLIYTLPNANSSTYHLIEHFLDKNPHMVNVTPDGRIVSTKSFDFESDSWIDNFYIDAKTVMVTVSSENQEKEFLIRITVTDVNDEKPTFRNRPFMPMVASMKPDSPPSTVVYHLAGRDPDRLAEIRYKITKQEPEGIFEVVENNGAIKVKNKDPLPERTEYILYVEAVDIDAEEEQSTGVAKLSIMSGYRPPMPYLPSYTVSVKEDTRPGTSIFRLKTISFIGSSFTYTILDAAVPFWIKDDGHLILKESLDRESEKQLYRFTVQAQENNTEAILSGEWGSNVPSIGYAEIQFLVLLDDVNDNAPRLKRQYQPVLYENQQPKVIVEIEGEDDDDRASGNGPPFTFSLYPSAEDSIKNSFNVTTNTTGDGVGIISSLRVFDREEQSSYVLPVVITDAGNPPLSSTSLLTVVIGDVDDNPMQEPSH